MFTWLPLEVRSRIAKPGSCWFGLCRPPGTSSHFPSFDPQGLNHCEQWLAPAPLRDIIRECSKRVCLPFPDRRVQRDAGAM
jgi:hypothetical protein